MDRDRVSDGDSPLLNVREAAHYLRMSAHGVYEAISRQRIPCVRLGKSIRIKRSDLDRIFGIDPVERRPASPPRDPRPTDGSAFENGMEHARHSRYFSEMINAVRQFHEKHNFKGTPNEDLRYRMALLVEELGEISAAVTKGLGPEKLAEEHADLLILLLGNAVSAGIPLESAFWKKLEVIMKRPAKQVGDMVRITESG